VSTRIAPSAALEAAIEELLAGGLGDGERLAEIGRLGARLVLQRAVEEEVTAFVSRARYERTSEARGSRNGNRPRQARTAPDQYFSMSMSKPRLTVRLRSESGLRRSANGGSAPATTKE